MKSTLIKLATAAAVSLAFAAPASAAIGTGDTASLFLEVFDTAAGGSTYIRDLGVSLNNFGTQNRPTGGFTDVRDNQVSDAQAWTADATWTTFISGVSSTSNLIWDVIATDSVGGGLSDQRRVAFTSLTDVVATIAQSGTQQPNGGFNAMPQIDTHIAAANGLLGAGTSAIALSGSGAAYDVNKNNTLNAGLGGAIGVTSGAVGNTMGFFYMTRSSGSNTAEAIAAQYKDATLGAFNFTLASNGTLSYAAAPVAAVPEPSTWAMFAAGALMLAGIGRRRMR